MKLKKFVVPSILCAINAIALSINFKPNFEASFAVGNYDTDAATYYNDITATSGTSLLGQLHDLITTTHKTYTTYDDCKNPDLVYQTDPGTSSSYVTDIYTQKDIAKTWGSGSIGTWNREHVWCQSLSGGLWGESGGGGDIHHIRPDESGLNSTRGNSKFADVHALSSSPSACYARNKSGNNTDLGGYRDTSLDIFEPLDSAKGDIARIVMYVYTHYNTYSRVGGTTNGSGSSGYFGNLPITNIVKGNSTGADSAWALLLSWNALDPVSSKETTRNEAAARMTGCRNPFIDHPEYANAIWGNGDTPTPPSPSGSISISKTSMNLTVGGSTSTISATSSDSSNITWSISNSSVATISSTSSASGSNITVTPVAAGSATITAKATINSVQYSKTCSVTVSSGSSGDINTDLTAGTYSIVATDIGALNTGYASSDGNHTCASGLKIKSSNCCNQDSKIQFKKTAGYIYNTEALPLSSLTINGDSGLTVYAGNSSSSITSTISISSGSYNLTGYTYFKVSNGSSSTIKVTSINVTITGTSPSPASLAEAYAKQFNEDRVCGTNDNTSAISNIWLAQKTKFEALDSEVKAILTNGAADQYGSTELAQCLARYDRVLLLHGDNTTQFPDFMGRITAGTFSYTSLIVSNSSNNYIVVILISVILTSSFISLLFIFKKKKN